MIRLILAVALLIAACTSPPNQPLSPLTAPRVSGAVYLPIVGGRPGVPTPAPTATATVAPVPACWNSWGAYAFYWLLRNDYRQQRARLECDPRLVLAARRRALAQPLDGLAHCDSAGVCANAYARAAGCKLPAGYTAKNEIESLAAGTIDPLEAFRSLARSPDHARHLFGENDTFREQDRIGIAMVEVPGHRYRWVWVVLIARCEGAISGE